MASTEETGERLISTNRKARYEYHIIDSIEAGIVLKGSEVKSLRQGKANISEGYAFVRNGEVWLDGVHISPYTEASYTNVDPARERKLLLHNREIGKLKAKIQQQGYTLIPLKLYFKKNVVKVELGIAQGKKAYDKRQSIAKREAERSLRRKYAK